MGEFLEFGGNGGWLGWFTIVWAIVQIRMYFIAIFAREIT
jgi:hypothetical protein